MIKIMKKNIKCNKKTVAYRRTIWVACATSALAFSMISADPFKQLTSSNIEQAYQIIADANIVLEPEYAQSKSLGIEKTLINPSCKILIGKNLGSNSYLFTTENKLKSTDSGTPLNITVMMDTHYPEIIVVKLGHPYQKEALKIWKQHFNENIVKYKILKDQYVVLSSKYLPEIVKKLQTSSDVKSEAAQKTQFTWTSIDHIAPYKGK